MEESSIVKYFEGKTIFIMGATGFLAKVLEEKILRVQPNIKRLFLLIRATNKKFSEQRLHEEVFGSELFRVLRQKRVENSESTLLSKVTPVSGDVSLENLGINDVKLRDEIWREVDIIVNSAATTRFDERYDVAFGINTLGAINVLSFAKRCSKLKLLVHISTAFVHDCKGGVIQEKSLSKGEVLDGAKLLHLDIYEEKRLIEETLRSLGTQTTQEEVVTKVMREIGIERATLHGWANTYAFTKAMGEMLLQESMEEINVQTIIIRPTIITSTFKEPFPGWIEGVRTMDSFFLGYGKGKLKLILGGLESILDVIPVDMVVNSILAAIWASSINPTTVHQPIYHVGSSSRNPIKIEDVQYLTRRYLTKYPMLDKRGNPIKVKKPIFFRSTSTFRRYIAFRYLPFIKILKLVNKILCGRYESSYANAKQRIERAMRMVELFKPYMFSDGVFDDTNAENLRIIAKENQSGVDLFNFDPKCINWEEYFWNTHFPGFVKYVVE